MSEFYKNSIRHLSDQLVLADLLIHREILRSRPEEGEAFFASGTNGLFVTGKKLDEIIEGKEMTTSWFRGHGEQEEESADMNKLRY